MWARKRRSAWASLPGRCISEDGGLAQELFPKSFPCFPIMSAVGRDDLIYRKNSRQQPIRSRKTIISAIAKIDVRPRRVVGPIGFEPPQKTVLAIGSLAWWRLPVLEPAG